MNNKYDVIIIGAGLGGLTAATILSKNGKKVLILEKNYIPGGYAVSFTRRGFEFDAGLHLMYGCKKEGNTYNILKECDIDREIRFLKPKYLYRAIFPDYDLRVPQCNLTNYINILQKLFPQESRGIEKLFDEIRRMYNVIFRFDRFKIPSSEFIFSINTTCKELLSKYLKQPKLKAIIFQQWPYFGLPPSKLPVFYLSYPWFDFLKEGGYYPLGGAKTISKLLAATIKKNGGEILFNAEVKEIIINKGVAIGVELKNRDRFYGKAIISNIDTRNTFFNLVKVDNLPHSFIRTIKNFKPSISAFQVYLGLKIDLRKVGFNDYEVFVNPSYNLEKQFIDSLNNRIDIAPYSITAYSNLDNSVVLKQKSILVITVFSGYDFWKRLAIEKYKNTKEKFARTVIDRAESIIPNLSKYIEVSEIATPLTMERYSGNYKGAIYGWAQTISQTGFKRFDLKTPIKNLYLAGAWTRPGGGITGVMYSGKAVADRLLGIGRN